MTFLVKRAGKQHHTGFAQVYVLRTKHPYHYMSNSKHLKVYFGAPFRFINPKKRGKYCCITCIRYYSIQPFVLVKPSLSNHRQYGPLPALGGGCNNATGCLKYNADPVWFYLVMTKV